MKYCRKCGNILQDENKFCPHCGQDQSQPIIEKTPNAYTKQIYQTNYVSVDNKYQGNTLGLVSIGLGVTIPLIGLICGINAITKGKNISNNLAIILGIIGIIFSIFTTILNYLSM